MKIMLRFLSLFFPLDKKDDVSIYSSIDVKWRIEPMLSVERQGREGDVIIIERGVECIKGQHES